MRMTGIVGLLCLLAVAGTCLPQVAFARSLIFTGKSFPKVQVDLSSRGGSSWDASVSTFAPPLGDGMSCGGAISGRVEMSPAASTKAGMISYSGSIIAPNLFYKPDGDVPADSAKNCTVTLTIVGRTMSVVEGDDGCMSYHGASCDFDAKDLMVRTKD